jgi:site-specific recombinase XerD
MTSTEKQMKGTLKTFTAWWFAEHSTGDWTTAIPEDLRDYRDYLVAHQYAPATIRRHLLRLRQAFGARGLADPTKGIKSPSEAPLQPQSLGRNEKNALLRAIAQRPRMGQRMRDMAIAQLMLHAGLRTEEVLELAPRDLVLNPRSGEAKIHGKGNKMRTVPLNKTVREALSTWMAYAKIPADASTPLFPIADRTIRKNFDLYATAAGVSTFHVHMLRHTCAHDLIQQGVALPTVASLLGHQSLHTTFRYTIPALDDLQKAVNKLVIE